MFNKTKEMLIQEAIVFVNRNIHSCFRGKLEHKVTFSGNGRIEVLLYPENQVYYAVVLFLDERKPHVIKYTRTNKVRSEVM